MPQAKDRMRELAPQKKVRGPFKVTKGHQTALDGGPAEKPRAPRCVDRSCQYHRGRNMCVKRAHAIEGKGFTQDVCPYYLRRAELVSEGAFKNMLRRMRRADL